MRDSLGTSPSVKRLLPLRSATERASVRRFSSNDLVAAGNSIRSRNRRRTISGALAEIGEINLLEDLVQTGAGAHPLRESVNAGGGSAAISSSAHRLHQRAFIEQIRRRGR